MNENTVCGSRHEGCERDQTDVKQTQPSVQFASNNKYLI
jgi:hypothetical protein